jgi:preprotein translocase subunit SecF
MFDIAGKRFWFFLISEVLILLAIVSLATPFGRLKAGIDFSSGSMIVVTFQENVTQADLQQELANLGYNNALVQAIEGGNFQIRTQQLTDEQQTQLIDGLSARFGPLEEQEFFSVSPAVALETVRNAAIAVAVACVGILIYIAWAFRRMPRPFHYGTCAVIALVHDVLVTLGIYSVIGAILHWEIDLMFVIGVLAIIGYSVNNTVVVFDRIRENVKRSTTSNFEAVVNNSQVETLGRCFNTTITTLIAVLAVLLFVGSSIQNFAVVLLVGIIVGTYDSICVAPGILIVWDRGEWGRLLQWPSRRRAEPATGKGKPQLQT